MSIEKHFPTLSREEVERGVDIAIHGPIIGPLVSLYRKLTGKLLYK